MKRIRALILALLAGSLLSIAGVTPASAAFITLCNGYSSCTSKGMGTSGYSAVSETMFWRMAPGHNCTNYVAYRLIKNGMTSTRPWSGTGNAYNWGLVNAGLTDRTPKVGAVAWWAANARPIGPSGHVAYVEKVISSTEILISDDNWHGNFHWRRITKASYWPTGFIHFADRSSTGSKASHSPIGAMDRAWAPTPGRVSVTGWAFDSDAKHKALSLSVTVGAKAGSKGAEAHSIGAANWINKEVGAAYPGIGNYHGMYATFTTRKRGNQEVYLYASNAKGTKGHRTLLGVKTLRIADPDPRGHVDAVSSPSSRRLRVKGWTFDPNSKTVANRVRVYVGGPAGRGHRVELGLASLRRADVAKAYPSAGKKHGFDETVKVSWTGRRKVYVYGLNAAGTPGQKTLLGTRTVTIKR